MNTNLVVNYSTSTDLGFSKSIWDDCPIIHGVLNDTVRVAEFYPDNLLLNTLTGDAAPIAFPTTQGIRLAVTAAANADSVAGGKGDVFIISDVAATAKKLWCEFVFKLDSITDNAIALGLTATADVATDILTNTSTVIKSTAPFVGFNTVVGAPQTLRFQYQDASGAAQTVAAAFLTIVAATVYKVGFKYDPAQTAAKRVTAYLNGAATTSYITGTNIAAATFPQDLGLTLVASIKTVTGAVKNLDVYRGRVAQLT